MSITPVEQHQNQAIAQKLGISGEKVTSMAGLKINNKVLGKSAIKKNGGHSFKWQTL